MKRREFIKKTITTASLSFCSQIIKPNGFLELAQGYDLQQSFNNPIDIRDPNPIQTLTWEQFNSSDFNGDDITRTHEALWNTDDYISKRGGIPSPTEYTDTVIVGGGCSGLLSAYYLQNRNPIILEQAGQFGGNSRGEYFNGQSPYSIGAAYITKPDLNSDCYRILYDLKLLPFARPEKSTESRVFFQNQFLKGFWEGNTDPQARKQFLLINAKLEEILEKFYPDIPWSTESALTRQQLLQLDSMSFYTWLISMFGNVHQHILEYFQLYCWSSFGGSIDEISAAQALNFLAAETDEILAFPGGNAAIAQALYSYHYQRNGSSSVRAGALVLSVQINKNGVDICYEGPDRKLYSIRANHCVLAAPKFIAKRIVKNMSEQQQRACDAIEYRSYIVANLLIKKNHSIFSPCFELYCLEGAVPPTPSALKPPNRPFTDICFGSWAYGDQGEIGVLSIYKALPYQGARQFLFNPLSHNKHRQSLIENSKTLIQQLGITENQILGIRLTRWGHALPLAQTGALSQGFLEAANQTIDNKIFFANQDNWVNPSFETAVAAASEVANQINSI